MVAWQRRVAGADQFRSAPIHRSESPTGYSSAGCSPAEPASASPVADNSTSNPGPARQSKCAAQPHCRDPVQVTLLVPVTTGCHLHFARRVTFLSCADTADQAFSVEQFHARIEPNNATRLSGKQWLCAATRA